MWYVQYVLYYYNFISTRMNHFSARLPSHRVVTRKKSQQRFTNFETYPQNQFQTPEYQQNIVDKEEEPSIQNNLMQQWIQQIISENTLKKQALVKAKEIIQQLQRDVERVKQQVKKKDKQVEKNRIRIKMLQKQLQTKDKQTRKTTTRITQRKIQYDKQPQTKSQIKLPILNCISKEIFAQYCNGYEKVFEEFMGISQREKQQYQEQKYHEKAQLYRHQVEQDIQEILTIREYKHIISVKEQQIIKLVQNYEHIIKYYKQYCLQLKTSLNESVYNFKEYVSEMESIHNYYDDDRPDAIIPTQLLTIICKQIIQYISNRESQIVSDNQELKQILDGLISKIRK